MNYVLRNEFENEDKVVQSRNPRFLYIIINFSTFYHVTIKFELNEPGNNNFDHFHFFTD